ncbi:Chitin bind 3 domain containing protein [Asbolus verrucosus]|uniref:Chitin bind 3 domain containing protein n=1 Tax=Asbolus verrucosus TaxID=1661398 RepID=A0A482V9C6_ASBVE|nr:Chitin bind 3 domain containing protein [Asbolus verrucosus]
MSPEILSVFIFTVLLKETIGHGMMLEPPNRSSLWRFDESVTPNYQDNQIFCGGAYVQWGLNGGKCGVCGDTYTDPHPQENENTGKYGQGKIVRTYQSGSIIDVEVYLSKNHLGSFEFSLCEIEDSNSPESGEDCFQVLPLADGSLQYSVLSNEKDVHLQLQLPQGKTCAHCVLRWHYRAGNNWGDCGDGTWAKGCGAQETFRTCADIAIVVRQILGHGMMLEPPNRSSLWRYFNDSPINYDDNQNFCGGRPVQWDLFNGSCGVCGDRFDDPHPQANENTGTYGRGVIARTYASGSEINVTIELTSNHKGNFQYSLCVLEDPDGPESGEDCFCSLILGDGKTQFDVSSDMVNVTHSVILPYNLKCDRCVLRWHYTAGNSWGDCGNGTSADGCGPQETFRSCADVRIV